MAFQFLFRFSVAVDVMVFGIWELDDEGLHLLAEYTEAYPLVYQCRDLGLKKWSFGFSLKLIGRTWLWILAHRLWPSNS